MKEFFSPLNSLYFNSAYFGPIPLNSQKKIQEMTQRMGDPSFWAYDDWMNQHELVREKISQLFCLDVNNITHATSVSDLCNIVSLGHELRADESVVSVDASYPSIILPWLNRPNSQFILLKKPFCSLDDLKENLPKSCKIFCISWVAFNTGFKADILKIGEYLQQKDILFVVDASQYLGSSKPSKQELEVIDCLFSVSYKWLVSPYGHAFGYFSKKAQERIFNHQPNWIKSVSSKKVYNLLEYTLETKLGARKYDRGQTPNLLNMAGLQASLDLFINIGIEKIQDHNTILTQYFVENIKKNPLFTIITPESNMGHIIAIKATNIDSLELEKTLKNNKVDVSIREGNIRLSFHLYNTKDEVDQLLEILQEIQ